MSGDKKKTKRWRFSILNRELLLFLVFLLIALGFWFIQTFKDAMNVSLEYKVVINGTPQSVIFTSNVNETVTAKLYGRGFMLLRLWMNSEDRVLEINFNELKKTNKSYVIDNDVWKRAFDRVIPTGITVSNNNLPYVEIFYSNGEHKNVPVKVDGVISADQNFIISDISLSPEFVDVYAPMEAFDTITAVYTKNLQLTELQDTVKMEVELNPPTGVKCVPNLVTAMIAVDLQTTKRITVPIYTINIPENIILKPFPMTVDVTFQVSAAKYDDINNDEFNFVIDYQAIKENDTKCDVIMNSTPQDVYNVKYSPHAVDYVIEMNDDIGE